MKMDWFVVPMRHATFVDGAWDFNIAAKFCEENLSHWSMDHDGIIWCYQEDILLLKLRFPD